MAERLSVLAIELCVLAVVRGPASAGRLGVRMAIALAAVALVRDLRSVTAWMTAAVAAPIHTALR